MLAPYVEISKDLGDGFKPFAKVEVLVPLDGSDKKARVQGGVNYFWQATKEIALSQKISAVYVTGTSSSRAASIARYDFGLSVAVSKNFSVDLSNSIFIPLNKTGRETQIVPGLGVAYKF